MRKTIKVILGGLGLAVAVFAAVIGYVVATFDPNEYRQDAADAVTESTGRTLKFNGDIRLSVFPNLGMSVSDVSLSGPHADEPFVRAEEVRVTVRLLPLLSKRVEVNKIELKGVVAHVIRSKDGTFNIDDLTEKRAVRPAAEEEESSAGPAEKKVPETHPDSKRDELTVEIAGIVLNGGSIDYTDQATGKHYTLSNVKLETEAIGDGVPSKIDLSFILKADQPALDLNVSLKTIFLTDAEKQQISLTGLELTARGQATGIANLDVAAGGNVEIQSTTPALLISKLAVAATGKQPDGDLNVQLDLPKLVFAKDRINGDQIRLDAVFHDAGRKIAIKAQILETEGSPQAFKTRGLEASVDMEGEEQSMKGTLQTELAGSIDAKRYEFPRFSATLRMSDPRLPEDSLDAKIEGAAQLDLGAESLAVELATQLNESRIDAKVGLTRFESPAYTFDIAVDQLNTDRSLAKAGATRADANKDEAAFGRENKSAVESGAKSPEKAFDLARLKGITADGRVRIGHLKTANISSSQVRAEFKLANGRLDVNPVTANLYGGSLAGAFSAQAASTPVFSLKQKLSGINVGPLLKDAANTGKIEGKGDFALDVTTQGITAAELKKAIHGTAALNLVNGSIKGIDLAAAIGEAKSKLSGLGGMKTLSENLTEKSDFSEMKATFHINSGIAHNSDFLMKSPLLRVTGEGNIDIVNERLDYRLRPTIAGTIKAPGGRELPGLSGVVVPVHITGPIRKPQYTLDSRELAEEIGKGFLERAKEDIKGGDGGKKIQERLKILLGR